MGVIRSLTCYFQYFSFFSFFNLLFISILHFFKMGAWVDNLLQFFLAFLLYIFKMGSVGGYAVDLLLASTTQFAKRKSFSLPPTFQVDIVKKIRRPSALLGLCWEQNEL